MPAYFDYRCGSIPESADLYPAVQRYPLCQWMAANAVQFDKRTYTVDEIQDILGISRTSAYNLVKKKVFHSVRIGGSIRISKKSFDEWLDHQM